MTEAIVDRARREFHRELRSKLWILVEGVASNSDRSSTASVDIGLRLAEAVGARQAKRRLTGSAAGAEFERHTTAFLRATFPVLQSIRPGKWNIRFGSTLSSFEQYAHLGELHRATSQNPELAAALGSDYLIRPDLVVVRSPEPDETIDGGDSVVSNKSARLTSLRTNNQGRDLLHASVSCKWTIRSDRTQNARAEASNLIRNRKGRTPHIVVVTGEPLPSRLASICLGTGDIDCTYHIALYELQAVLDDPRHREKLATLVDGNRLRDVSDLPLDLAV